MKIGFSIETGIIVGFNIIIIIVNVLIILILCRTNCLKNVNKVFFYSLTLADLCLGLFITPYSILTSFFGQWIYGNNQFCQIEAYLVTIFWIAGLYSLMCINADHYVAIQQPERYSTLMSPVHCICWTMFIWIVAFSFCCPPLFAIQHAKYYKETYICIVDTKLQLAYFVTAGLIATCPPIFGLLYTIFYLYLPAFQERRQIYEMSLQDITSRPQNYVMNSIASVMCILAWIPWCALQVHNQNASQQSLHFYFLWLAIGSSFYKFFVYLIMSREFRNGLYQLWNNCYCLYTSQRPPDERINSITSYPK